MIYLLDLLDLLFLLDLLDLLPPCSTSSTSAAFIFAASSDALVSIIPAADLPTFTAAFREESTIAFPVALAS